MSILLKRNSVLTKSLVGLTCRSLTTAKANGFQELDPLHQGHRFAKVPQRQLLEMEGPDSTKFLQGLITNHMPLISAGGDGFYTAFLTPQGRTLYDVFIYPVNVGENFPHQKFILDYPSNDISGSLLRHLKRYVLRSKVKMRDVSDEYSLYHIWGHSHKATLDMPVPVGGLIKKNTRWSDIGCIDPRVPGFGYRAVIPNNQNIDNILPSDEYSELPAEEYTIRRLLQGIPEGVDDIWPEQSLPLESNLDYMNGVDFRKGCYVGQELTIRTYHTGVVRKRIVPVQLYKPGDNIPQTQSVNRQVTLPTDYRPQLDINLTNGTSKRGVGKTCSGIHNIGLALMRLEHIEKCAHNDSIGFKIKDSEILLRPFLPSWWTSTTEE
ncbi:uncharacterized protein BX664DRAFT_324547 [Halteromyces radiatus]|uniref:uncharacterized protein n=1 Tax=Halteromyces radiatus TaxID=101107 RepID=UPI002220590F|nr:uncharacterized protein BX664DRAFT_324547 [Halteromyces radiatus]KAI8096655.1 hypothetical protein BX664DRAFT_324547 [Halteromyces radiatus]